MSEIPEEKMLRMSRAAQWLYGGVAVLNLYSFFFRCHHWEHMAIAMLLVVLIFGQRTTDEWRKAAHVWRGSAELWRQRAEGYER